MTNKRYECPVCGEATDYLTIHLIDMHLQQTPHGHRCWCGRCYEQALNLAWHLHHEVGGARKHYLEHLLGVA